MRKIISIMLCLTLINCSYGQAYKTPLDKINQYLIDFDNGYYGHLEIKEGYLYDYFKSGDYSKANIYELSPAVEEETGRKIVLNCNSIKTCVFSTYTNSYHDKMQLSTSASFNTSELITLFNQLITAYTDDPEYKKYKNSSSSNNEDKIDMPEFPDRSKMADERRLGTFD